MDVEKEPYALLVPEQISTTTMEINMPVLQRLIKMYHMTQVYHQQTYTQDFISYYRDICSSMFMLIFSQQPGNEISLSLLTDETDSEHVVHQITKYYSALKTNEVLRGMDEVEHNHLSEVTQTQKESCHTFCQVDSSFESSEVFQPGYPQKLETRMESRAEEIFKGKEIGHRWG